jgi:hypothetical protein
MFGINKNLKKQIDKLTKNLNDPIIGEVYGYYDVFSIQYGNRFWSQIRNSDILDEIDNKIKIQKTWIGDSSKSKAFWYDKSDVIFYDDIYNKKRKQIENKYEKEKKNNDKV